MFRQLALPKRMAASAAAAYKTPVSLKQDILVRRGQFPKYDPTDIQDASHKPKFRYRVTVADVVAMGTGHSKKAAKHAAAKALLDRLRDGSIDNMVRSQDSSGSSCANSTPPEVVSHAAVCAERKKRKNTFDDAPFSPFNSKGASYSNAEGYTSLRVTASPSLNQDQLWKLFDLVPDLNFLHLDSNGMGQATAVYYNPKAAAYAKEKLDGFEYPPGDKLTVKPDADADLPVQLDDASSSLGQNHHSAKGQPSGGIQLFRSSSSYLSAEEISSHKKGKKRVVQEEDEDELETVAVSPELVISRKETCGWEKPSKGEVSVVNARRKRKEKCERKDKQIEEI